MTRTYEETKVNEETMEREHVAFWSFSVYPGNNNIITVTRNGVSKTIKVVEDSSVIYKLQATQVRARKGASGLFEYIDKSLYEHFMECLAWKVLRHCFFDCREVR